MSDIPIRGTIALDHCWVCGSREGLNEHHVVPQSCGGTNGPTVTLCAAHHTVIHTEAYHPDHARRFTGTPAVVRKLAYLADVIHTSFNAVRGQAKPVLKSFVFSVAMQKQWATFRSAHPGLTNDQQAMEHVLQLMCQRTTPLKRR